MATPALESAAKSIAPRCKLASISRMAGYDHQPDGAWDEYEWERFLQQQDHKTEKYMELLEKYLDDPQRDQIIAREMGWTQLLDGSDWSEEVDALLRRKRAARMEKRDVQPNDASKSTAFIAPLLP